MKVTSELKEGRQAVLNIEVEANEVETGLQEAYKHVVKQVRIPGFRPGKAPRDVLERLIGHEALLEDAVHHIAPEACEKALAQEGLQAISQPEIEVVTMDPFVFKATISLPPVIEIGNYREIKLSKEKVEVSQEDIDRVLDNLRHRQALWQPVERAVKFGDLVVVDGEGKQEDKTIWNRKNDNFEVTEKGIYPVPGFAEELVGMEKGQNKTFSLMPPSGEKKEGEVKPISFTVKLQEIKEEILPELNDEFAKSVGDNLTNFDELKVKIKEELHNKMEEESREKLEDQLLEKAVAESRLEYPSIMVEREIANLQAMEESRFKSGRSGVEQYLKLIKKTEEEHREDLRVTAEKRLRRGLVLDKLREAEKIEVVDADVDEEIERRAKASANTADIKKIYTNPDVRASLRRELVARKTIDSLIAMATQEKVTGETSSVETVVEPQKNQGGDTQ